MNATRNAAMDAIAAVRPRISAPILLGSVVAVAVATAAIIVALVGEPALAGGFAAAVLIASLCIWMASRIIPQPEAERAPLTDWTVARAAAHAANLAVAVTDRTGRLVCASDQYGEWFPGYPTPPQLKLSTNDIERLNAAGRAAWRDGEASIKGVARGALLIDIDITRTGRADDYLLWRFQPVQQASVMDDFHRVISGDAGQAMAAAGMMLTLIGAEGRVRAANAAFLLRATGRPDSNIVGRDLAGYLRVDAKGRIFFAREEDRGSPVRMTQVQVRADDPSGPLLLLLQDETVAPIDAKSSLAYIEALVSLMPFGLAMADRDGRLLFYNRTFARAAGVEGPDQISYPGDLVIAEDQPVIAESVRRYAVGPQMSGDVAVRLRSAVEEPVSIGLAGVRGLGDAAVLLSLKDSSEEFRLKRQVAQQTKMQAVGQLAGGVAHDFNNILTAIIGHCDLMLMRHTPGDSDYDDIQQIKSNSNRAASLTRQLLAFSRQQTLRPQVLQLPDVVSDVSSLLKRLLGENVRLSVTHGRGLGSVRADPGQLEQVIVNLVVNARDAMPEGGTVTVTTEAVSADDVRAMQMEIMPIGRYTKLSVADTGIGIAPDALGKIFEPFYTTKEVGKGTGLGLSMVYGIVKQSGGFIFAESEVGAGTRFDIYLPVYDQPAEVVQIAAPKKATTVTDTWGSGTILLVEDEDMVRNVAERALQRQGYTVITARDGEQGLEALEAATSVDLLISDVVMPAMDGPTMVRKARERYPNLPVLFMSGYAEEQLRKSIDIDDVAFLPKPFSVNQLAEAARDALMQAAAASADKDSGASE